MTRNAAGMPVNPVVAYAVGMTPAATVSGATPARTKNSTAGTPSRSRARARDTLPGLVPVVCVRDIECSPGCWVGMGEGSDAVGEHGAVHGGLGLGDQLPQAGIELPDRLLEAAAGAGRQVQRQLVAQPAGGGQPGQDRVLGSQRAGTGSSADFTRTSGANAQSGSTGTHRPARQAPPRGPGQVPGLFQPAGHVRGGGAGQEQQPVPRPEVARARWRPGPAPARPTRPRAGAVGRSRPGRAAGRMLPASISSASSPPASPRPSGARLQMRPAGHLVVGHQVQVIGEPPGAAQPLRSSRPRTAAGGHAALCLLPASRRAAPPSARRPGAAGRSPPR